MQNLWHTPRRTYGVRERTTGLFARSCIIRIATEQSEQVGRLRIVHLHKTAWCKFVVFSKANGKF